MHKTEGFTYTAVPSGDQAHVPGYVRYGVVATAIDSEGLSGNVGEFFVVFEDQGSPAANEVQAIAEARRLAFTIGTDPGPFVDD